MIKTKEEILAIKKAASLGDIAFSYIVDLIKPGVSEESISHEIEDFLMECGAERLAFPTICVSGERTNLPHGEPSEKLIEEGDFVTLDFGAVIDGYCGDMTRTVCVGEATDKQREVYAVVLEAQTKALEAVAAGIKCADVDAVARDIIVDAGYGDYYIHGTGHGVGREVHEAPTINAKSEETLEKDVIVTIEPGIYIPGEFGVRIEDLVLVTDDGIINFVSSPKELTEVIKGD